MFRFRVVVRSGCGLPRRYRAGRGSARTRCCETCRTPQVRFVWLRGRRGDLALADASRASPTPIEWPTPALPRWTWLGPYEVLRNLPHAPGAVRVAPGYSCAIRTTRRGSVHTADELRGIAETRPNGSVSGVVSDEIHAPSYPVRGTVYALLLCNPHNPTGVGAHRRRTARHRGNAPQRFGVRCAPLALMPGSGSAPSGLLRPAPPGTGLAHLGVVVQTIPVRRRAW